MGHALDGYGLEQRQHGLDVDFGGGQQGLADALAAQTFQGGLDVLVLHVKDLAHQGKAVGVHAAGGQGDNHVALCHAAVVDDGLLVYHAYGEARQVVLVRRVEAGHFGGLAAHQGTASLHAALGHALYQIGDALGNVLAAGDVIQEHQGLGTGAHHVVYAHGNAVNANSIVLVHQERDLQLGAHTVGAGDQHRVLVTGAIQLKQAAKAAQTADAVLVHGTGDILLHQLHRAVTGGNVHACCGVAFRIALFHVLTLLTFWRPWDGRSGDGREYR